MGARPVSVVMHRLIGGATAVALMALLAAAPARAQAGISTSDMATGGQNTSTLASALAGPGVTITSLSVDSGNPAQIGLFSGGAPVGIDSGVVMSTGAVADVAGPNTLKVSTSFNLPGDAQLDALVASTTVDAASITMTFVPIASKVTFSYVFSSEEYPQALFDDPFGAFINGENCALVPGTTSPITPFTVNGHTNSAYFIDNSDGHLNTQMDGLTTVLTCTASVTPNASNTLKLAIADESDGDIDSAVFIKAHSLAIPCTQSYTGVVQSSVRAGTGRTCFTGATVNGSVTVPAGANVILTNTTVSGALSSNGALSITSCGSSFGGSVAIANSTGPVTLGDGAGCSGNTTGGAVMASRNTGGVTIGGNRIKGSLTCSANQPPPTPTTPNQAAGKSGQCVIGF